MARNRYYEDEKTSYKFNASSVKKALKYCIPYKKILISMSVLMLVMSFVSLLPPMINTYIVDYVLSKKGLFGLDWLTLALILVGAYALAVISTTIFSYFRTLYMTKTGHAIVHDMRYAAFNQLQKLAFDYYDSRPGGKILVRVTAYLDELAGVFSNSIIMLLVDFFKIIIIMLWLFVIDYRLAGIIVAAVVPMAVCVMLIKTTLSRRRRAFRNKRSNRTAYIAENIQGNSVTKAFNRVEKNTGIQSGLNMEVTKKWEKVTHINELHFPIMDGFFYVGLGIVYVVVIYMATSGSMGMGGLTIGKLIGFISYMGMLSAPLNDMANILQQITMATSNLESVFEVIDTQPTVTDADGATELPEIEGNVSFEHVYFSYEPGHPILTDVTFDIPKGKMIALVGPTGAGKSTIVSLLSRFYDLDSGRITIDGHDISQVTLHSLRSQVGVMMQDSFIFSGTIIDNIRYARPDATDEECIAAAKLVSADEFISKLPDGYYTKTLEQGSKLSTGERQLISFARVVLTDPKILILDEATSSIDTHTEEMIKQALDVILEGRTSFVIAHRLSTIRKADCIFYVADRTVAEAGTHEQLMEKKGLYYKLVKSNCDADDE
jgi:hypothetical protein